MDDRVRDLYRLDPGEFVAARGRLAKQVRAEGDRDLATQISALRRPTVAAWGLNLLAGAAPEQLAELLAVGAELAQAQRRAAADRLRELAVRRRTIVAALTRAAAQAAADHDRPLSDSVLREITETLQAALADPETAEAVRTGTVTAATSYSGFGPMGPALAAVPNPAAAVPNPAAAAPESAEPAPGGETSVRAAFAKLLTTATEFRAGRDETSSTATGLHEDSESDSTTADLAAAELDAARATADRARAAVETLLAQSNRNAAERADLDTRITALRAELTLAQDRRKFLVATEAATRKSLLQAERELYEAEQRLKGAGSRRSSRTTGRDGPE